MYTNLELTWHQDARFALLVLGRFYAFSWGSALTIAVRLLLLGLSFDHRCAVVALWLKVSPPEALRYKAESEREAVRIEAGLRSNLRATSCKKMVMR